MEWVKNIDLYFTAQEPIIGTFLTPQANGTPQGYQKRPPMITNEQWTALTAEELKFLHKDDIKKLRRTVWEKKNAEAIVESKPLAKRVPGRQKASSRCFRGIDF